ncbi:MAG: alpha-1,2-fucosyltransferase [Patescibacteria group bacterium]
MITSRKFKFGRSGLGNWLFNYAGTRLYAEKNGFDFAMPDWIGTRIFQNIKPWTATEKIKSFFCRETQLDDLDSYTKLDALLWLFSKNIKLPQTQSLESLYEKPKDNISLYAYLQDEFSLQLLKQNREKIKDWFTFNEKIQKEFQKQTKDLKPWIGVHIRRGDYIKLGISLPVSQYKSKLDEILKQLPNYKVFIATNDRNIISEFKDYNLLKASNPLSDIPDYVFDFWMLVNSEWIIGGGSTFSWWAAFLSDKDYYHSPLLTNFWTKDYRPEFALQDFSKDSAIK